MRNEDGVWTFIDLFGHVTRAVGAISSIDFNGSVIRFEGELVGSSPPSPPSR